MSDHRLESKLDAHIIVCETGKETVMGVLERHEDRLKEHDALIKPPWWRPWAIVLGFVAVIVSAAISIGATPSRTEYDARRAATDVEFKRVWDKVGELGWQTARTETEIKNINTMLNKLDSKMDVILMKK